MKKVIIKNLHPITLEEIKAGLLLEYEKSCFFDVDNVLVNGQTQKMLLHFLFKNRKMNFLFFIKIYFWLLLYKFHLVKDVISIRKKSFKIFENWGTSETRLLFKNLFEQQIKPQIFSQSIKIIQDHINQGYEVILVSVSLSAIVEEIKEFLNLKSAIATKLEILNGNYTGKILGSIPYGVNKVKAVKNFLENNIFTLDDSYAYADHFTDLHLLKLVKNPIVINPGRKLRNIARVKKWSIYDFKFI